MQGVTRVRVVVLRQVKELVSTKTNVYVGRTSYLI